MSEPDERDEEALDDFEQEEDDMAHEDHRAGTFLAGLAIGALMGAGVALLFAPRSGEETRGAIARRTKHLARDARDRYDDVKDKLRRARRDKERADDEDEVSGE